MSGKQLSGVDTSDYVHSITQAKRKLNMSHTKIFSEIRVGRLEARKIGRRTVITDEALRRYIAALPIVGAAQNRVIHHRN